MTNVRIGSKIHRNIDKLTVAKLEHLLQLAETQITNYKNVIANYPPRRMEMCGKPHLKTLETTRDVVSTVLKQVSNSTTQV
jgi:hypothetical protein